MKKKICIFTCVVLIITTMLSGMAFAASEDELNKKLDQIEKENNKTQQELNQGKQKEKALTQKINALEKSINSAENELDKLTSGMKSTEEQIAQKIAEIQAKQDEINKKDDNMNARLRVMYKNGDVGLIQILLGSNSFTELLSNIDIVRRIYQQDMELLASMKSEHTTLEKEKKQLEQLKTSLSAQKEEVDEKQNALEKDKSEYNEIRKDVRAENKELEKLIDDNNRYAEELTNELRKLMGDDAYAGGSMAWPAPGYTKITSPYGNRLHPILKVYKMHTGIDIGVPRNNKVVAANDGTVIKAGWSSGYGNTVIIDHGGGIATLYAHNTSVSVSVGAKVKRGQQVAISGSTGNSTGPHLHFEVRVDGKHTNPMSYLK